MFKNYLITAYRNIIRQKLYSFINIFGLAIGLACCILILLWINFETSFDRFHEFADTIYRVNTLYQDQDETSLTSGTAAPLANALVNKELPEILHAVRFAFGGTRLVGYKKIQFREKKFKYADPSFFQVFSFPLKFGNPSTAFSERYSVVLTEEMSEKYFGDENPIGKLLKIDSNDYFVTGVLRNIPSNSQLQFNFLLPFHHFIKTTDWGIMNYMT